MTAGLRDLAALIDLLKEKGVYDYEYNGLRMHITPPPAPSEAPKREEEPEIKTYYDHPSLWRGGRRIGFGDK